MRLGGGTRLVGILGWPVAHSLSPRMQNAAFAAAGLDWVYVPLPVDPRRVETAVAGLVALGFAGANVTIPHKTAVVAYCDELDPVAERCGSVNTLVVREGRVLGSSTDGEAVVGAAVAVATALADAGCASLRIAARSPEKAHALALRLLALAPDRAVGAAAGWPPPVEDADLVVQATPVRDDPLVELGAVRQVVDLAYGADGAETALVRAARAAGCERVVDGLDVLVAQGAASFARWTGRAAPVEAMRAAVRETA